MKLQHRRLGRMFGLALGLALPVTVLGHVPAAQAVPRIGPLIMSPASGNQSSLIEFSTPSEQSCPGGTEAIQVLMTGGILTEELPGLVNGNTDLSLVQGGSGNLAFAAGRTLGEVFAENGITSLAGTYTIRLQCLDSNLQATDEFNLATQWTAGGTSGTGTYVAVSTATATQTALAVGTPDPVAAGTHTSLTATVTPSDAVGSVRFKNGSTFISTPIAVAGGTATLDDYVPLAGANSLTAVFTPTDAGSFGASTSSVRSYAVLGAVSVTGTAQVGRTLTCATQTVAPATALPSTGRAVLWLKNGAATATTTTSVKAPGSWYNQNISCRVTLTKSATSVNATSATRKVALGAALKYTVRPKVLGVTRVARTLTCSPGRWTPAAGAYRYQWFRGATAIRGKVARTYRTVRVDKGKLITCRVTAVKAGYKSGVAKAPARKVT